MVNRYSYIVNESIQREFFMKIQEIARLANVSTATVSRVFSRHPNVREEVREAVLEVARKYNYRPRLSGKQKNVVLITPYKQLYPAAEFVEMVTSKLIQQLSPAGFRIEIVPHDNLSRLSEISFCGAVGIGIGYCDRFRTDGRRIEARTPLKLDYVRGLLTAVVGKLDICA